MMAHLRPLFLAALLLLSSAAVSAQADPRMLVADLSRDEVAINTNFNGTDLLLFGAVKDHPGSEDIDIIVAVSGPSQQIASRRKDRVSGIWINTEAVVWKNAPTYYHVFTSRPMAEIVSDAARDRFDIGHDYLPLSYVSDTLDKETVQAVWRPALSRNMTESGLWATHENSVEILRDALFRATVRLPANILPGDYQVRVLQLENGQMVAEEITAITVAKRGLGAAIYRFAHDYSAFYGIFAIIFAIASGWLAAVAFRRK